MSALEDVRARVAAVPDPEMPFVTIAELGILRGVEVEDGVVHVLITPTYSGCPAMEAIRSDVRAAAAPEPVVVDTVLAPAWTTDWITEAGLAALADAGIAPPGPVGRVDVPLAVRCPRCGSLETRELSRFSATACTALRVCGSCREPFGQVKPL